MNPLNRKLAAVGLLLGLFGLGPLTPRDAVAADSWKTCSTCTTVFDGPLVMHTVADNCCVPGPSCGRSWGPHGNDSGPCDMDHWGSPCTQG